MGLKQFHHVSSCKKLRSGFTPFWMILLTVLSGCGQAPQPEEGISDLNRVTNQSGPVHQTIGQNEKYEVLNLESLRDQIQDGKIIRARSELGQSILKNWALPSSQLSHLSTGNARTNPLRGDEESSSLDETLLVGFPVDSLSSEHLFGATIVKVSSTKKKQLGDLKLQSLTPRNVMPLLVPKQNEEGFNFYIAQCKTDCDKEDEMLPLVELPIVGVNQESRKIILDLSALGEELQIMGSSEVQSQALGFVKQTQSKTTEFDFSNQTLVFDIKSTFEPIPFPVPVTPKKIEITARWFLRSADTLDPEFTSRGPTEGVGYFMAGQSLSSKIQKFSQAPLLNGKAPIKYYIKNVPPAHQAAFSAAFKEWNELFRRTIGNKLLRWEFINEQDERLEKLIPGDARYNIIEWDKKNVANYSGLGPSMANQRTGQVFSANILIQGDVAVERYQKWFKTRTQMNTLMSQGQAQEAELLRQKMELELTPKEKEQTQHPLELKVRGWGFKHHAQSQCALAARMEFEEIPQGETYESYMFGYFKGVLLHELGHNLGLRHNFKGSLVQTEQESTEVVSHSIMEYLGSSLRHRVQLGQYDEMAIAYGYKGIQPHRRDLFCTDENVPGPYNGFRGSAECSRDDATQDPISEYVRRIDRGIELFSGSKLEGAPLWTSQDVQSNVDFQTAIVGLALYAMNSEETFENSTQFGKEGRPQTADEISPWILNIFKGYLCDEDIEKVALEKTSEIAQRQSLQNIGLYRMIMGQILTGIEAFEGDELSCPVKDQQPQEEELTESLEESTFS